MLVDPGAAPPRHPSQLDRLTDSYIDGMAATISPIFATTQGLPGADHRLDDFSPEGYETRAVIWRDLLGAVVASGIVDGTDRVTAAALKERLTLDIEAFLAGDHLACLNNIASPLQEIRGVFDLMPTATARHWTMLAVRLARVPWALAGYVETLAVGAAASQMPAARQVQIGIAQARALAAEGSFFATLAANAALKPDQPGGERQPLPRSLAKFLERGAMRARMAYGKLADFLEKELAPKAPAEDAVGRERYRRASRRFLGANIDFEETYAWGEAEVARVIDEQRELAAVIGGAGTSIEEAITILDRDEQYRLKDTAALRRWMAETSAQAIDDLDGRYFDIPAPLRQLECLIAPTHDGGIYYTGPGDGFTRPGRMWWSVPESVTEFSTWRERSTVYHEGVPGHHLQIGQTLYETDKLNRWRRLGIWVSGHGEGWALYAESLMDELGLLPTPADRMGMLVNQRLRACRVVIDLGIHLRLPCPEAWGGGIWDEPKAWRYLTANVSADPAFLRFELDRYLGWPGQAASYKIGQRLWEQARADAESRAVAAGQEFSLKAFHQRALALGSLGLDTFAAALADEPGA
ncbi:MAG: DUF885 domain-containing protein [Bifidobacteriaceae bacterium]|jgi:uncharacterized protein (DUF885 family)|nr:DUF885 domain-containing protein [Bifidobacteriaceae bacterium]